MGLYLLHQQVNATSTVKAAEKYLDSKKIAYAEKTVENSADVKSVTQSLIDGGCDVIFVPNDSVVQDGVSALTELCQEKKIPTYCSSATTVASGCTATLAIDDKGIGEKTAEMAIQYFDGKGSGDPRPGVRHRLLLRKQDSAGCRRFGYPHQGYRWL